jgi:putative nucleotidyltransferase with HDIG domain
VSTIVAGWVFKEFGGVPYHVPGVKLGEIIRPFVGFTLTFLALNHGAVALAISLSQGERFIKVLSAVLGPTGTNLLYDLLVSPLALGVAILYQRVEAFGLVVSLLPLLFVRGSYLTSLRLQQANRDLLKALVMAIETRDPYTSGHSLRVQALAKRIAVALGLSGRRAEAISTAALLHDVGKIDAVYSEILRKPDSLSAEERRVIESHVTKGVELLTSLSSFPGEVVSAVRHHHEREDGKGYPDGLRGEAIPLGAKIIKVCDAIDAMLSDRPYRSALSLPQVKEQLITYAGIQFDPDVVRCVVRSTVLEDHQEDVASWQDPGSAAVGVDSLDPSSENPFSSITRLGRRLVGKQIEA